MAYQLLQAGDFDLSKLYNARSREAMGSAAAVRMTARGTVYNVYGGGIIAPQGETVIRRNGMIVGDDYDDFDEQINQLRVLHSTQAIFRRKRYADGEIHSADAWFDVSFGNVKALTQEATLNATLLDYWRGKRRGQTPVWGEFTWGDGWIWGGDVRSGDLGDAVTLPNGNAPVIDAVITVTCTSGNITSLSLSGGKSELTLIIDMEADDVLVIDNGAASITRNGVAVLESLQRGNNHLHGDWLRIEPDGSEITISAVGGAGTHVYAYREAWK